MVKRKGEVMILFRKAILIIHGFAGGTYDQEELANFLEKNSKFDVYTFTLPGHEKRSFRTVKYEEWIDAAEKQLKKLISYGYKDIYLIGHSMGGVIATYLSTKYRCIKKLVLVAPSFKYFVSDELTTIDKLKNSIDALKNHEADEVLTRFLKLPLTSLNEFIKLVAEYKDCYLKIKVPTMVLHGTIDTIVPIENSKELYESIPVLAKKIMYLDDISHDVFEEVDEKVLQEIEWFLKN